MNLIPLPWMLLGIFVAVLGAGGAGYWQGGRHMADKLAAQEAKEAKVRAETRQLMMQAAAQAISQIEVRNVTIRQKAETITREVPVYADCKHGPEGLALVNAALTNAASIEQPNRNEGSGQ